MANTAIQRFRIRGLVLCTTVLVLAYNCGGQSTQPLTGCTMYDETNVYNVQLLKNNMDYPCQSVDDITNKFKSVELRSHEVSQEVMKLQSLVLRLMEQNLNLTSEVSRLQTELKATQDALLRDNAVSSQCPRGYKIYNSMLKSCYMLVPRLLSWYHAQSFCMSTRGHLVALESQAEVDFILAKVRASTELPGNHIWTGGNDIGLEDQWMWAGINQPINYTKWLLYPHPDKGKIQMPDNHQDQEHCIHLFHLHDYDWNDIYCGYEYYFICEYKLA